MDLDAQIEAILFFKAEPVSLKELVNWTGRNQEEISRAMEVLDEKLAARGLILIKKDDSLMLGTTTKATPLLEKIQQEELSHDLGKAALETLAIIAYEGPIGRADIDYIRGVNSSFILRSLLVRGLIERITDQKDSRRFLYRPTFDLLRHLGLSKLDDLPEYTEMRTKIEEFKKEQIKNEHHGEEE